jgi:hypothetical protein
MRRLIHALDQNETLQRQVITLLYGAALLDVAYLAVF